MSDMSAYYDRNYYRADKKDLGGWPVSSMSMEWEQREVSLREEHIEPAITQIVQWAVVNEVEDISELLDELGLI